VRTGTLGLAVRGAAEAARTLIVVLAAGKGCEDHDREESTQTHAPNLRSSGGLARRHLAVVAAGARIVLSGLARRARADVAGFTFRLGPAPPVVDVDRR
jgi:hypothetical protein